MKRLLTAFLLCGLGFSAWSAEAVTTGKTPPAKTKTDTAKVPKDAAQSNDIKQGLDIIGSQDAPLELNIIPWKDKEAYLPKNALEASVLNETLDPIDRDVVKREVEFSRALQMQP